MRLNTDGASRGNPGEAGGGGILRDSRGRVLIAFSFDFGVGTNMLAELRALMIGIRICKKINIIPTVIEMDSNVIVELLNSRGTPLIKGSCPFCGKRSWN